jgi:Cu2+-containing amine oxidase
MQMQKGILIPHILRYDIDKIRLILNEIEGNKNQDLLKLILDERMDGCRNLFHACVHIGIPLTNKEYLINDEQIQSETNNIKRISFAIDHLHSQTNTDHNYGNAARSNNSSNITEQSINTWPPPPPPSSANEPAVLVDTQPPSSPTMPPESTSSFYRVRFFLN